jgi:hypothetical protein
MRFVAFAALLAASCAPSVDPKVESAVVNLERFAAEAVAGDCIGLKAAYDAAHADEGLKAVEAGSHLEERVKAAEEKVKPLFDACAAQAPAAPVEAPAAPVEAPAESAPADAPVNPAEPPVVPATAPVEAPAAK